MGAVEAHSWLDPTASALALAAETAAQTVPEGMVESQVWRPAAPAGGAGGGGAALPPAPEHEAAAGATVRGSAVYDVRYDDGDFAQLDPRVLARWPPA